MVGKNHIKMESQTLDTQVETKTLKVGNPVQGLSLGDKVSVDIGSIAKTHAFITNLSGKNLEVQSTIRITRIENDDRIGKIDYVGRFEGEKVGGRFESQIVHGSFKYKDGVISKFSGQRSYQPNTGDLARDVIYDSLDRLLNENGFLK